MLKKTWKPVLICCAGLSLLLSGCTPSVQGLYVAPSFTYHSIHQDNIGVAGVVPTYGDISIPRSINYSNIVQTQMNTRYPGLGVMPAGEVARALGSAGYKKMLTYYSAYGVVKGSTLKELHEHIRRMRYLTFARITQNHVSRSNNTVDDNYNQSGKPTSQDTIYTTKRSVTVSIKIYDTQLERAVWMGTVSGSKQNKNDYPRPLITTNSSNIGSQLLAGLGDGLLSSVTRKEYHYPSAPGAAAVFSDALAGMTAHLPKMSNKS